MDVIDLRALLFFMRWQDSRYFGDVLDYLFNIKCLKILDFCKILLTKNSDKYNNKRKAFLNI